MTLIEAIKLVARRNKKSKDEMDNREFKWLAIDKNDLIFAYELEPTLNVEKSKHWFFQNDKYLYIGSYTGYPIAWKNHSLI